MCVSFPVTRYARGSVSRKTTIEAMRIVTPIAARNRNRPRQSVTEASCADDRTDDGRQSGGLGDHDAGRSRSSVTAQQHLDSSALVHGPVALGGLAERQLEVEHFAGVDLPVPDQVDQLG
jgi:hypothetical protein